MQRKKKISNFHSCTADQTFLFSPRLQYMQQMSQFAEQMQRNPRVSCQGLAR